MQRTVKLSVPIYSPDGIIHELTFRDPTPEDYLQLSTEFETWRDLPPSEWPRVKVLHQDRHALAAWVERLSGVHLDFLHEMSLAEGREATRIVRALVEKNARLRLMN